MTLSLDYVLTHWGENWCWSLFRLNGLEILGGKVMPSLSWCQSAANLWVKTNRITYLVETTEPLFSFSHVFLLIICIFPILESVWKNLPCRQYYVAAKHLFLLELFTSLSLFFFAQCELQYARLLVTVYVDHFFFNSSVRFVSGSSLCFDSFSKQDKLITQGVLSKQRRDWLHNAFVMVTDS